MNSPTPTPLAFAPALRRACAVTLATLLLVCSMATPAFAATKSDVIAKIETLGLPAHLMGIGYGVAKSVDFDAATGDAIMGDIDRAIALVGSRSVYELGTADSTALINLCAASLERVGISTTYAFNPKGGADITLTKNGAIIAKFNTRDTGVVRTGAEQSPWVGVAVCGGLLAVSAAGVVAVRARRGTRAAN